MRAVTFLLGAAVVLLAFATAWLYSEAHRAAADNGRLEREIGQLLRERDRAREQVERERQPAAVQARLASLGNAAPAKTKKSPPPKESPAPALSKPVAAKAAAKAKAPRRTAP